MLKMPLVTFIVTSYNYEKFIEKTLESIRNQSYKNFEIIVVDDFSQDNSVEIIEKYIQCNQDIRISLIKHSENFGQMVSMIDGLKIANGVFVSFIDSDDYLHPDYAAAHLKVHLSSSVAFTTSQIIETDENDEIHTTRSVAIPENSIASEIKSLDDLLKVDVDNLKFRQIKAKRFGGWYWAPNSSAMCRKSAVDIIKLYKNTSKWRVCPDKFVFNLLHLIGGSIMIDAPLTARRLHKNNAGQNGYITGNIKYNNNKTTGNNIKNNLKIRPETLFFMLKNKVQFTEKFGTRGFLRMFWKVLFF